MNSGFKSVSLRCSAIVVSALISACMATGCKDAAVKPAEGVQTAAVESQQAPTPGVAVVAAITPVAVEAKPLFRPEGSMLKAGTRLTYRFEQTSKNDDEHRFGVKYVMCDLLAVESKPTADSFTVRCSAHEPLDTSILEIWQDSEVYEWKAEGLWLVTVKSEPADGKPPVPQEPILVFAKQADPKLYVVSKLVSYDGSSKAFCTAPPGPDEYYSDSGETTDCYDLRNGYIVSEYWIIGTFIESIIWKLVDVSSIPASGGANKTDPAVETAAKDLLARWLRDQNLADFEDYKSLYAPSFTGVRRTDRAVKEMNLSVWLTDRGKMFAKPMTVAASDVKVLKTGTGSRILFTQYWQSGKYADEGPKEIVINNGYPPGIIREEMIDSKRVPVRQ